MTLLRDFAKSYGSDPEADPSPVGFHGPGWPPVGQSDLAIEWTGRRRNDDVSITSRG
jgi:hypothetical protein